jgi:hypothetical protein
LHHSFDHDGVVTVLAADMETIARSAAIKYRGLEFLDQGQLDTGAYDRYGRAYLQKLVQIQFDLPPTASDQLRNMLLAEQPRPDNRKRHGVIRARVWSWFTSPGTRFTAVLIACLGIVIFEYSFYLL